jgi:hypothetical protein
VDSRRENLYFDYLLEHIVEIWPQKKFVRSGQLGPIFHKNPLYVSNFIFQVEKKKAKKSPKIFKKLPRISPKMKLRHDC